MRIAVLRPERGSQQQQQQQQRIKNHCYGVCLLSDIQLYQSKQCKYHSTCRTLIRWFSKWAVQRAWRLTGGSSRAVRQKGSSRGNQSQMICVFVFVYYGGPIDVIWASVGPVGGSSRVVREWDKEPVWGIRTNSYVHLYVHITGMLEI